MILPVFPNLTLINIEECDNFKGFDKDFTVEESDYTFDKLETLIITDCRNFRFDNENITAFNPNVPTDLTIGMFKNKTYAFRDYPSWMIPHIKRYVGNPRPRNRKIQHDETEEPQKGWFGFLYAFKK